MVHYVDLRVMFYFCLFVFIIADFNNLKYGPNDNQARVPNSNSVSSLKLNNFSEKNYKNDGIIFLSGMKAYCFTIPRFLPPCEWIRSQSKILIM